MSIATLEAAPPVRAAREALAGSEAWLVGGVVRDALLDRPLSDVDLAVHGDPEQIAKQLARAVRGPAFSLSDTFGAWRVLSRDRATTFDVSPLQGPSIEEDLAKRDFSVNAIAVALEGGGEPIDPHGGRRDLETQTLRVLGPEAYAEDPLRPLRLIRFAAELGLTPDATTERLTAEAAPRLTEPSPERVFAELRRIVVSDRVLDALALAERLQVLNAVLPELIDLEGLEQSRFHHLDVYHHTMEVLGRLIEIERDPAAVFGEHAPELAATLAEPLGDDLTRGQALRFGALLHDIAKPETRGENDGRPTFIGHDRQGEQLSRAILTRLRTSERLRAYVGALCRHHLALGFLIHEQPLKPEKLYRYLHDTQPVEVEVTVLSCADRMATRAAGQEPWISTHLALGAEVMGPALRWRANGPPPAPLRGDELARELGIAPGPELGRLLAELEQAAYTGEVEGREQAVAFARRRLPDAPESPA